MPLLHLLPPIPHPSPPPSLLTTRNASRRRRGTIKAAAVSASARRPSDALPSDSALRDFWRWLGENGAAPPPSVKVDFTPEGIGLVAERVIPRGQAVVEVPKPLWIDPDAVAASPIGGVSGGLRPWVSIALFLLRERAAGPESRWRPYLDILPSATDSTIFWSEEELSEIQGTQLLRTTMGVKEYVQSEFIKVEDEVILPNKHLFLSTITLNDFLWAFGILRSRSFSRLRGEKLVLIPLADLINHDPSIKSEESCWEISGKGLFSRELVFSLRTPVYVKAGEQDEKLMQGGGMDARTQIAVGIRAGEKKVLHQIDGIFRERELELDGLEYYQERRLKDLGLVGELGDLIFWESK